jgi:hypothetical protein
MGSDTVTPTENTAEALREALEHDGFPAAFASSPTIASIIANDPTVIAAMRADGIIPPTPPTFKLGDRVRTESHGDGMVTGSVNGRVQVVPDSHPLWVGIFDATDLAHLTGEEGS